MDLLTTNSGLAIVDYRQVQAGSNQSMSYEYILLPFPTIEDLQNWSDEKSPFRNELVEKLNGEI